MRRWEPGPEEDPLEARIRRELGEAASQVEPTRTLADLRRRILIWRLFHRHPRRLRKAARSEPEPATELIGAVVDRRGGATAPPRRVILPVGRAVRPAPAHGHHPARPARCVCGRPTWRAFCCWACMVAQDGGWVLQPWSPAAPWTDVHTWTCEDRSRRYDPRWHAGTAPQPPGPWRPDDPPMPDTAMPPRGPRAPADVRYPLEAGVPTPPEGGLRGVPARGRDGQPGTPPGPAGSYPVRQRARGGGLPVTSCSQVGCPPLPSRATACHCHGCHQTFGTLTLFDAHQDWAEGWAALTCRSPGELGLVLDHHGTWQTPQGLHRRQQDRLRLVQRGRPR